MRGDKDSCEWKEWAPLIMNLFTCFCIQPRARGQEMDCSPNQQIAVIAEVPRDLILCSPPGIAEVLPADYVYLSKL